MSIVSLTDLLSFCEVDVGFFTIDASHDVLILTYNSTETGTSIDVPDGTYNGDDLATALQTVARASTGLSAGSTGLMVSYSSTGTKKFTLTATTGQTIKYTHLKSDAGLTFGFNQDHAAAQDITSDVAAGDPS